MELAGMFETLLVTGLDGGAVDKAPVRKPAFNTSSTSTATPSHAKESPRRISLN
ncbi:MAG: hypothetical protein LC775_11025 [Acidobacteria bacterium]|nr:hypothetical protein [Acidobacteriota bacterium]